MSEHLYMSGKCLCKAVSVEAHSVEPEVEACHCHTCRKWGGSAFVAMNCGTQLRIEGEEAITVYDSSEWAQRGFCKHCGTHLFYRLKQNQQYIMPVGLFDTDAKLTFTKQIFIDQKPEYYDFANQTKMLTGEQIFAAFVPSA